MGADRCVVVFLCRIHTELLPFGTIWTKLAISLVKQARKDLAGCPPRLALLHRDLGSVSLGLLRPLQTTCMVHPDIRHWFGVSSVVSDALVDIKHGSIRSMGRRTTCQCPSRTGALALAWPSGYPSRRR